jgi:hypothetical protein
VQTPVNRQRRFEEKVQTPVNRQRRFHSQKRIPVSRQPLFPAEMPLPVGRHRDSRNQTLLPAGWPLHFGKRMRTPARRQPVFLEPSALGARPRYRLLTKTARPLDRERFFWRPPRLLLSVLFAMTVSMHRTLASLRLPTKASALVQVARAILEAMTNNRSFPNPSPSLAAIAAAIADLQAAEVATLSRTRGTAAARDDKRAALVSLLVRLKGYVQGVADDDPDRAATLIESAGMNVKPKGGPAKAPFDVKPGAVSGSVRLVARAVAKEATYQWAWSTDGGATWRPAPVTPQAKTVLSGLPSDSKCWFRCRTVTRRGEGNWSESVAFLVR